MQIRHKDRNLYFKEQEYTTRKYVIPLIERVISLHNVKRVLEIGC